MGCSQPLVTVDAWHSFCSSPHFLSGSLPGWHLDCWAVPGSVCKPYGLGGGASGSRQGKAVPGPPALTPVRCHPPLPHPTRPENIFMNFCSGVSPILLHPFPSQSVVTSACYLQGPVDLIGEERTAGKRIEPPRVFLSSQGL